MRNSRSLERRYLVNDSVISSFSGDQSQRIVVTSALGVPASPIMVQENSLLCTRNASSSNSTSSIGSTSAMPLTSSLVGNNNVNGGSSSVNDGNIYSSTASVPTSATISSQQLHQPQQQQQYYPVAHFQQYHHSCHQQQQLLNLFNNGCHVSTNNATLSHMVLCFRKSYLCLPLLNFS